MSKLPIILLTGFLGAGKTTLLNRLLKAPALADSAVLINEFGDVALDHHLIETATESTVVLDSGCICCTVRGALSGALRKLFWELHDGKIPSFKRIIIETTGLADPVPIMHELLEHPTILQHYRLAGVITCVDGIFGTGQLARHPEAFRQAAVADTLLVTKADLADAGQLATLTSRLRAMNPDAAMHTVANGGIDARIFLALAACNPRSKSFDVQQWLKAETYRQVQVKPGIRRKGPGVANVDVNRHGADIQTFCLTFDQPLPLDGVIAGFDMLAMLRGDQILRIKGILNVEGQAQPMVIHGVQHLLFPPTPLANWPDESRQTKLVFIVRDIDVEFVVLTLNHFIEEAKNRALEAVT